MLQYPKESLREYSLTVGSHLLTVNTYRRKRRLDLDLIPGINQKF